MRYLATFLQGAIGSKLVLGGMGPMSLQAPTQDIAKCFRKNCARRLMLLEPLFSRGANASLVCELQPCLVCSLPSLTCSTMDRLICMVAFKVRRLKGINQTRPLQIIPRVNWQGCLKHEYGAILQELVRVMSRHNVLSPTELSVSVNPSPLGILSCPWTLHVLVVAVKPSRLEAPNRDT